jgi:hypothetical protein
MMDLGRSPELNVQMGRPAFRVRRASLFAYNLLEARLFGRAQVSGSNVGGPLGQMR